jgi:hypothetical protein
MRLISFFLLCCVVQLSLTENVKKSHQYGEALNIVNFSYHANDTTSVNIDHEALDTLLMHSEVKDRKIVVVSIVGDYRGGKSFFLDYCLRFLYANVSKNVKSFVQNLFIFSSTV